MIGRIIALAVAMTLVSMATAWADEIGGEEVVVPPPPPAPVVIEETVVEAPPPPFVELESKSIGAGIGISWGDGTLFHEGERYGFTVKGLAIGDLGASQLVGEGDVSNLHDVADFAGRYVAVEAGAAAGVGASALTMRNENGVVISLQSNLKGAQVTLGAEAFSIELQ